jgi:hypothetical protein
MPHRPIAALLYLAACLAVSLPYVRADDEPPPESAQIDGLITYYYMDKDPADVVALLKLIQDGDVLAKHDSAAVPFGAFLATVFSNSPEQINSIAKSAKFTGHTRRLVQEALWQSGHAATVKEVFGESPGEFDAKPVSLKKRPIKGPDDLDMMWGAFLASGDTAYVKRIIPVLGRDHPLSGDPRLDEATRQAAEWSLESNMLQHELVYRLIRKEAKSRNGEVRQTLREILKSAKPNHKLSHASRDGNFHAALFIMEQEAMAEFQKPSDAPLKLASMSTARRGDIVGIKILFYGIELAADLSADVVYDLKVIEPGGGLYDDTDLKDLKALAGKVPTRFRFFNNAETVMLRFEPKDKLGTYQIMATIRDQIGGKSVALQGEITLEE